MQHHDFNSHIVTRINVSGDQIFSQHFYRIGREDSFARDCKRFCNGQVRHRGAGHNILVTTEDTANVDLVHHSSNKFSEGSNYACRRAKPLV